MFLGELFSVTLRSLGIGWIVTLVISLLYGVYTPGIPSFVQRYGAMGAVLRETIVFVLLGLFQHFSGRFFYPKGAGAEGLAGRSLLHFGAVVGSLLAAGLYLRWIENGASFFGVLLTACLVYGLVWGAIYWMVRRESRRLNEGLARRQQEKN